MSNEKQLTPIQQMLFELSNAIESKESIDQKLKMGTTKFASPICNK